VNFVNQQVVASFDRLARMKIESANNEAAQGQESDDPAMAFPPICGVFECEQEECRCGVR